MRKIPELDMNSLLKISSIGAGASFALASMFVLFYKKFSFPKDWLLRIDMTLAFCVVMFSMRATIELMKCMEALKKYPEDHLQEYLKEHSETDSLTIFKKAVLSILAAIFLCFALVLIYFNSPPLISAAVISFIIIAAEIELFIVAIKAWSK